MTLKKEIQIKILVLVIVAIFTVAFTLITVSCKPEMDFGDLAVCEEVDAYTFAPLEAGDSFNIEAEKIFAAIEVHGVKAEDNWRFIWSNQDTGEVVADSTGSYSAGSGYIEGFLSNSIVPGEEGGIIGEPGSYRVNFYHKDQLISSADFVIEVPELKIIEVVLSNEVDDAGKAVTAADRFSPGDVIYASVKLNCELEGETIGIKWYRGQDELLDENQITLYENFYMAGYKTFRISNEGLWPAGSYRAEIFHNGVPDSSYSFKVIKGEIDDATFYENKIYDGKDYKFSINYPDGWKYIEEETGRGLELVFTPVSDDINAKVYMYVLKKGYFPGKGQYSDFADKILTDVADSDENVETKKSETTGEVGGISYKQIDYHYTGEDENNWDASFVFINKNSMLYMVLKISGIYYQGFADKLFETMLQSLLSD